MELRKDDNECFTEKWKRIIDFFYLNGEIVERSKERLFMLLSDPEISELLNYETIPSFSEETMKEEALSRLRSLREIYEAKDIVDSTLAEEILGTYGMLKKRWGVNVEKYVKEIYEKMEPHVILNVMFCDVGKSLSVLLENRICYRKYGKYGSLEGGFHCQSPIKDLVISNVSRGTLYKRTPKDMKNKAEYDYDKNGRLILYKWHLNENDTYFTEMLLYGKNDILHIRYERLHIENKIQMISMQSYQEEYITSYEETNYIGVKIYGIETEAYSYKDGLLNTAWQETCSYPKFQDAGHRHVYFFEKDNEDYLCGYRSKAFWGDGEVDGYVGWCERWGKVIDKKEHEEYQNYVEVLPDKKRRDTGRDAGRWRRPNCFSL